jgi:hypothetical protein
MPISYIHNTLFIHIPKTGGGSIEKALGMYGINNDGSNTQCSKILYGFWKGSSVSSCNFPKLKCCNFWLNRRLLGQKYLCNNDSEKALQHLTYAEIESKVDVKNYFKFSFVRNPFERLVSEYFWRKKNGDILSETFVEFVDQVVLKNLMTDKHLLPQHLFLEDNNGKLIMDFVGHFENLYTDFSMLCEKLKINASIEKIHSSKDYDYRDYYVDHTKKLVGEMYSQDLKLFNYKF